MEEIEQKGLYVFLTIFTALCTGLIFALNTMHIQLVIEKGFNIDQANYDGNLIFSFILFIIWIIDLNTQNPLQPDNIDFVIANVIILMVITGVISFGNAMYYGKAGQVQAI